MSLRILKSWLESSVLYYTEQLSYKNLTIASGIHTVNRDISRREALSVARKALVWGMKSTCQT